VDEAAYLRELVRRLEGLLAARLLGAYAAGSFGLGDFDGVRSDLDVFAVCRGPVPRSAHLRPGARRSCVGRERVKLFLDAVLAELAQAGSKKADAPAGPAAS
jgi:hypothetical protein